MDELMPPAPPLDADTPLDPPQPIGRSAIAGKRTWRLGGNRYTTHYTIGNARDKFSLGHRELVRRPSSPTFKYKN
jgi:hypothetical protein